MGVQWVWSLVTEPGVHKAHSLAPTPGSLWWVVSTNSSLRHGVKRKSLCVLLPGWYR